MGTNMLLCNMGTAEEDLTEPSALEECCYGPLFLRKSKGLRNQVALFALEQYFIFQAGGADTMKTMWIAYSTQFKIDNVPILHFKFMKD